MKFFNLAFLGAFPGPNLHRKTSFGPNPLRATSLSNVVNLNVGGVKYSLFDDDIRKHPGSFFEKALEGKAGENKEMNIERDGEMFKFVNAFMVNGQLPRDQHGGLTLNADIVAGVKSEAEFFGLLSLQKECDTVGDCAPTNATNEMSSYIKIRKYLKHFKSRILKNPAKVESRSSPLSRAIHKMWDKAYSQGRFSSFVRNPLFKDSSPNSVNVEQLVDTAKKLHPATAYGNTFEIEAFLLSEPVLKELANECDLEDLFGDKDIEVRPNKLLIHTAGVTHSTVAPTITDTDRANGRIGTLVVILNNAYQGGEMDVRLEGQKAALRTGPYSYVVLQSDVEHSVRPVTSGARVSLMYTLYDRTGSKPPSPSEVAESKQINGVKRVRKDKYMYRRPSDWIGYDYDKQSRIFDYDPSLSNKDVQYYTDSEYGRSLDYVNDWFDTGKSLRKEILLPKKPRKKDKYMYWEEKGCSSCEYGATGRVYDFNPETRAPDCYETDSDYYNSPDFKDDQKADAEERAAVGTAATATATASASSATDAAHPSEKEPVDTTSNPSTTTTTTTTTTTSTTTTTTTTPRRTRLKDQHMYRLYDTYSWSSDEERVYDFDPATCDPEEYYTDSDYYDQEDQREDDRADAEALVAATSIATDNANVEQKEGEEVNEEKNVEDDASECSENDYSDYDTDSSWHDDDLNTPPLTRTAVNEEVRTGVTTALDQALLSADAVVVGLQHLYPDNSQITAKGSAELQGGDRALFDLLSERYDVHVVTANIYKEYDYDTGDTNMRAGLFESSELEETGTINTAHSHSDTTTTDTTTTGPNTEIAHDTSIPSHVASTSTLPVIKLVLPPTLTGEHTVGASEMEYHYRTGKDQAYLVTGLRVSAKVGGGRGGGGGGVAE